MSKFKTSSGNTVFFGDGFDEFALIEGRKKYVKGNTPVYIREAPECETYLFSKQPITNADLKEFYAEEIGDLDDQQE